MTRLVPILCAAGFMVATLSIPAGAQSTEAAYPRAELEDGRDRAEVTSNGVTARINADFQVQADYTEIVPVLEVIVKGKTVLRAEGVSAGSDWRQGVAEIVEMDSSNQTPEVVFSSYSGGAHCCTRVIVAAADKRGKWHATTVGDWDGGGDYIEDADGDGVAELVVIDNAFLYAFDCYACSAAPLKVLALKNGKPVNVTRESRFLKKHKEWLKAMESWGSDRNGEFAPGFFAGWVAQKVLLGEGRSAWETMLRAYKGSEDLGHDICKDGRSLSDCGDKDRVTVPFPKALTAFLETHGYQM